MNTATATLSKPIAIDGEQVKTFTLTEPAASQLIGVRLTEIMQMDVAALIRLIPRIVSPGLTEAQVGALPASDFMELAAKAAEALVPSEAGAAAAPAAPAKRRSPTT